MKDSNLKKIFNQNNQSGCPMMGELNTRNPGFDMLDESVELDHDSLVKA